MSLLWWLRLNIFDITWLFIFPMAKNSFLFKVRINPRDKQRKNALDKNTPYGTVWPFSFFKVAILQFANPDTHLAGTEAWAHTKFSRFAVEGIKHFREFAIGVCKSREMTDREKGIVVPTGAFGLFSETNFWDIYLCAVTPPAFSYLTPREWHSISNRLPVLPRDIQTGCSERILGSTR